MDATIEMANIEASSMRVRLKLHYTNSLAEWLRSFFAGIELAINHTDRYVQSRPTPARVPASTKLVLLVEEGKFFSTFSSTKISMDKNRLKFPL